MNPLRSAWQALLRPTLRRRSVIAVMLAFFVVWAVLVFYGWVRYQHEMAEKQHYQKFGAAILRSVEALDDPRLAIAAVASTDNWLNVRRREVGRLPGKLQFELSDLQGHVLYGGVEDFAGPHFAWEGSGARWKLRVGEPQRSPETFMAYNLPFIGEYVALALPFVLLPVWFSVRTGLRPLQRFASTIARRRPDDLRPLDEVPRHAELQPLARALDRLLDRLRQRLARERVFVQDAAHEIRTPLAVVTTQAHVMAHAATPEERQRAYEVLMQAIDRASHVAQQLLLLATLDEAQQAALREFDVAQATRSVLAQLAPLALARGMELSLEAPDRLPSRLDEAAFTSALQNLVDNAIRYGREGGAVVVTLRGDDERISLQVQDDGPGIPAEEQALVFERFYRGAGQEAPGSGLGLAIVRQAATRMGGQAMVTPGLERRGVGFLVSFPVPGFVVR